MYEDQTYENILDRSLARVASDVKTTVKDWQVM